MLALDFLHGISRQSFENCSKMVRCYTDGLSLVSKISLVVAYTAVVCIIRTVVSKEDGEKKRHHSNLGIFVFDRIFRFGDCISRTISIYGDFLLGSGRTTRRNVCADRVCGTLFDRCFTLSQGEGL